MLFGSVAAIAACNKGPNKIDYAHNGSVKLLLDYEDHDFFRDGIGEVVIENYIDGDTTHFKNIYGDTSEVIKSRYYGIDTPESTGAIQPFGKKASAFTKSKLENAAANGTIVISSPFSTAEDGGAGVYKRPETDSSGTRYLSLVWIHESKKHAPANELTLLNLWIVQEGLSWAKNTSEVPAYADVFSDAQKQAEKLVLNLWTDFDPDYNYGGYVTVSLLDIKREVEKYLADPDYVNIYSGQNVRFTAVVAGYCDHILYLQQYYPVDEDDPSKGGEWAGINFFVGMGAIPDEFTEVGALLELVGKATNSENFGFQISDGKFISTASQTGLEDDICKVLLTAEQNHGEYQIIPFDYTKEQVNELISKTNYESLYCRVNVTEELYCNKVNVSKGGDITLYFEGCDFGAYIPFTYYGDPTNSGDPWKTADKYLGKTFTLSGVYGYSLYKYNDGTFNLRHQIIVCGNDDLTCLTERHGTTTNSPYTVKEAVEKYDDRLPLVTYYVNGKVDEVYEEGSIIAHSNYPEITVTEAIDAVKKLPEQTKSSIYFIQGTVKAITREYDEEHENMSFTIGDGINTITVYNAKFDNGVKYTDVSVGCNVQMEAKLQKYEKGGITTPEVVDGTVIGYINTTVVTFTMSDGMGNTIKIEKAGVPSAVTDVITDDDPVKEQELKRKAIADYLAKVITGSTALIKGVPDKVEDQIVYKEATLQGIFLHGTRLDDPLTPEEAIEIASKLALATDTSDAYYIKGVIVDEPEIDRSNPKMIRINCTIELDAHSYYITGATFKVDDPDVTIDDVKIGARVIVTGRLSRTANNQLTTRKNGCQLVQLEKASEE